MHESIKYLSNSNIRVLGTALDC